MIILTALVDEGFLKEIEQDPTHYQTWKRIQDKDIYLITNLKKIPNMGIKKTIIPYPKLLWNYMDKIHYSFKLSKELDTDVMWVDFNKVWKFEHIINEMKEDHIFRYYDVWKTMENHHKDQTSARIFRFPQYNPLVQYIAKNKVEPHKIIIPMEECLYIPKGIVTDEMIMDVELGDGIMGWISFQENYQYRTIDGNKNLNNGEGLFIGYLLEKYKIEHDYFKISYFDPQSGWVRDYIKK